MSSVELQMLNALISKTESNISAIQSFGKAFLCPVLNEWRYATRHVVNAVAGDGDEYRKAVAHLRRAYYDSCDILIDCLLQQIADFNDSFVGYSGIVAQLVPDFSKGMMDVHAAREAHRAAKDASSEQRETSYDTLSEHVRKLNDFIEALEATENQWLDDVRRQKSRDRLPIIWTIIGIGVSIVLAIVFH